MPYRKIHTQTMMPIAHLTWSAVWSGLPPTRWSAHADCLPPPPVAAAASCRRVLLTFARDVIARPLRSLVIVHLGVSNGWRGEERMEALDFQSAMNLLKVNASELAMETVTRAMRRAACRATGTTVSSSVTRQLRDVLSAPIMINNDRILANAASAAMLVEVPARLRD